MEPYDELACKNRTAIATQVLESWKQAESGYKAIKNGKNLKGKPKQIRHVTVETEDDGSATKNGKRKQKIIKA
jgi:hypothetical protein